MSTAPSDIFAADHRRLARALAQTPHLACVLGSGLAAVADALDDGALTFAEFDGLVPPTADGHVGRFVWGRLAGVPVVAMQGRLHLYEGHCADEVVYGVRLLRSLGTRLFLLTNAAGSLRPQRPAGSLLVLADHINLTGHNPLVGKQGRELLKPYVEDLSTSPFVDMTETYDGGWRRRLWATAASLGEPFAEGVYAGLLGPSYETPAEIQMLQTLGADAVGMSTVLETIALRHAGAAVMGLSCLTNLAAGLSDDLLSHDDVKAVGCRAGERISALLEALCAREARALAESLSV